MYLFVFSYVDFINLMTYDLHGSWETLTGMHAGLFPRQADTLENRQLTVVRMDWLDIEYNEMFRRNIHGRCQYNVRN